MKCSRCKTGKMFLDRVFSDNVSFETSCLHCGHRDYVGKDSELGKWLTITEARMDRVRNGHV